MDLEANKKSSLGNHHKSPIIPTIPIESIQKTPPIMEIQLEEKSKPNEILSNIKDKNIELLKTTRKIVKDFDSKYRMERSSSTFKMNISKFSESSFSLLNCELATKEDYLAMKKEAKSLIRKLYASIFLLDNFFFVGPLHSLST